MAGMKATVAHVGSPANDQAQSPEHGIGAGDPAPAAPGSKTRPNWPIEQTTHVPRPAVSGVVADGRLVCMVLMRSTAVSRIRRHTLNYRRGILVGSCGDHRRRRRKSGRWWSGATVAGLSRSAGIVARAGKLRLTGKRRRGTVVAGFGNRGAMRGFKRMSARIAYFALSLALSAVSVSQSRAANLLEKNFWLSGPRYDHPIPTCNTPSGA